MSQVNTQRMTVAVDGDFVVFLIGMRINKPCIWHETFRIAEGQYEAVYSGMPAFGLGKVGKLIPASGARQTARGRFGVPV